MFFPKESGIKGDFEGGDVLGEGVAFAAFFVTFASAVCEVVLVLPSAEATHHALVSRFPHSLSKAELQFHPAPLPAPSFLLSPRTASRMHCCSSAPLSSRTSEYTASGRSTV